MKCKVGEQAGASKCEIFVSPEGRDNWRGTARLPFKTVERAQAAVRELRADSAAVTVTFADGTYRLAHTLTLSSEDSGEPGSPVVWRAAPGASPTLSGGRTIKGWRVWDASANIYRARAAGVDTRQLYVDNRRATRATTPELAAGDFVKTATGYTVTGAAAAALSVATTKPADLEVAANGNWRYLRCGVDSVTQTSSQPLTLNVAMKQPCWHLANLIRTGPFDGSNIHSPSRIENGLGLLDSPGEWYLDKESGWLYYKPRAGENLNGSSRVVAPKLETLILGSGTRGKPVHDIEFNGFTLADVTWLSPNEPGGYAVDQTGFQFLKSMDTPKTWAHEEHLVRTPGSVRFTYAQRIAFTRDHFTRLGSVGLDFDTGSQENAVRDSLFNDISHTGIQIGGIDAEDHHPTDPRDVTRDNVVADNIIRDVAVEYLDGPGIFVGYTKRTDIEHNELKNLPYSGIAVGYGYGLTDAGGTEAWARLQPGQGDPPNMGWTLYSAPTVSEGDRIVGNRISNYMRGQVDGGGIYTLGWQGTSAQNGMLIEGNVITQPNGPYHLIYLDAGTRFATVRNNVAFAERTTAFPIDATGGCAPWGDFLYEGNYWSAPTGPSWVCGGSAPDGKIHDVVTRSNTTITSLSEAPAELVAAAGPR